jgi:hypothetical protein
VTVATGWFGLSESFLPLDRAAINEERIRVPFDKTTIKNAPRYQSGVTLAPEEEDELYRHYNIPIDSVAARGRPRMAPQPPGMPRRQGAGGRQPWAGRRQRH